MTASGSSVSDRRRPPATGDSWAPGTFLAALPEPARAALLRLGTRVVLAPHRPALAQGECTTHALLLLAGYVKVVAVGDCGDSESLLGVRIGGEIVGEMAALSDVPRSASVITCAVTTARVISRNELLAYLAAYPRAGVELAAMIAKRLRWANERRVDITALPAQLRIRRVLGELMRTYGRCTSAGWELCGPLTQAEVASLAGVRLPTAEKALRVLQREGVLRLHYRRIVVLDLAALSPLGLRPELLRPTQMCHHPDGRNS